jgi:hypothetical protein
MLVLGAVAGAALAWLLAGAAPVNYDTAYGLAWGQQIAHGGMPQLRVTLAPTPKPLLTIVAIALGVLGPDAAVAITQVGSWLALGLLATVAGGLAAQLAGWPAGILAWSLMLTRVPLLSFGARAYVDVPYCALVLAAIALEVRRPRAGLPVVALLSIAGLLRPEAWLLAVAYATYCGRRAGRREQLRLVTLAVAAPLMWLAHDALLAGDPLWSLTGTRATGRTLERPTGVLTALSVAPRRVGEIVREPVLAAAALGLAMALRRRRREDFAVLAALLLTSLSFVVLAGAGLPALGRYLMLPAALIIVLASAGLVEGLVRERGWRVAAVTGAALLIVFAAPQTKRLVDLHHTLDQQDRVLDDARALLDQPAARAGCEPWRTPNHRLVPLVALDLDLSPGAVAPNTAGPGTSLLPRTQRVAELSLLDPRDLTATSSTAPQGARRLAANRSWTAAAKCSADDRPAG